MSSITQTGISISKKDLVRSRIAPTASRNIVFYHRATLGQRTISLYSLTMPAELTAFSQITPEEISAARLFVNKKNFSLVSSINGELIQGIDYDISDSYTIFLKGPYLIGAAVDEVFVGKIAAVSTSDLNVISAKSLIKTYTLAISQTLLNLGADYQIGLNPNDKIGSIKVFMDGALLLRGVNYNEVDSGNGIGSSILFLSSPASPKQIVVDFGSVAITDNNAIGTLEVLGGSIKKMADDLAVLAGTSSSAYLNASPAETDRRAFGDLVNNLNLKFDTALLLSAYVTYRLSLLPPPVESPVLWQTKLLATGTSTIGVLPNLTFVNLGVGKTYRVHFFHSVNWSATTQAANQIQVKNGTNTLRTLTIGGQHNSGNTVSSGTSIVFTAAFTDLTFTLSNSAASTINGESAATLEELPTHTSTSQWT